jgi:hypothetical protein
MALDMLATPSISSECETIFSGVKLIITDHCDRLTATIIEACECLRHWYAAEERAKQSDSDYVFDSELSDDHDDERYGTNLVDEQGFDIFEYDKADEPAIYEDFVVWLLATTLFTADK